MLNNHKYILTFMSRKDNFCDKSRNFNPGYRYEYLHLWLKEGN